MDFVNNVVDYLRVSLECFFLLLNELKNLECVHEQPDRQTAVFSKLVPSGIQRQGDEFVKNCIFFEMHHDKESANDEIKQVVEICDKYLKPSR